MAIIDGREVRIIKTLTGKGTDYEAGGPFYEVRWADTGHHSFVTPSQLAAGTLHNSDDMVPVVGAEDITGDPASADILSRRLHAGEVTAQELRDIIDGKG
jgi:hypothetical protein